LRAVLVCGAKSWWDDLSCQCPAMSRLAWLGLPAAWGACCPPSGWGEFVCEWHWHPLAASAGTPSSLPFRWLPPRMLALLTMSTVFKGWLAAFSCAVSRSLACPRLWQLLKQYCGLGHRFCRGRRSHLRTSRQQQWQQQWQRRQQQQEQQQQVAEPLRSRQPLCMLWAMSGL